MDLPFNAKTVQLTLDYVYTGKDVLTDIDTLPPLYYAANYLQISTLVKDCEQLLSKGMHHEISLEIWQIAKRFENNQVAEVAKSIVLQNFRAFCDVDSIGRIGLEDLKTLLQDKLVNCSGTIKCKAAWIWLVAQDCADIGVAKGVIQVLVASENVDNEDILTTCQNDLDELVKVVEFDQLIAIRALWDQACTELWISSSNAASSGRMYLNECLIIIGGTPLDESRLTVFNFKKKAWYKLETERRDLGHRYAVCSLGSMLYLSGGTIEPTSFLYFNTERKSWEQQENLPIGREQHNMCTVPENTISSEQRTVERKIYVLGGTCSAQHGSRLNDIHVYNTGDMRWSYCGDLAYAVKAACCTVVDKRIYLMGGVLDNESRSRSPSDMIQCFDTNNNCSWKVDITLPFKAKAQKMNVVCCASDQMSHEEYVVHDRKIYRLKLSRKNPNIEKVLDLANAPAKGFAVTAFGEKLFIFGGEDDNFRSSSDMLQFDTRSGQMVTLSIHTPFIMKDFVYTTIPVPESWVLTEYPEK